MQAELSFVNNIDNSRSLNEIRKRLESLRLVRSFSNIFTGKFTSGRLLYTSKMTCCHKEFDAVTETEYKCRVEGCTGIITENQIINQ